MMVVVVWREVEESLIMAKRGVKRKSSLDWVKEKLFSPSLDDKGAIVVQAKPKSKSVLQKKTSLEWISDNITRKSISSRQKVCPELLNQSRLASKSFDPDDSIRIKKKRVLSPSTSSSHVLFMDVDIALMEEHLAFLKRFPSDDTVPFEFLTQDLLHICPHLTLKESVSIVSTIDPNSESSGNFSLPLFFNYLDALRSRSCLPSSPIDHHLLSYVREVCALTVHELLNNIIKCPSRDSNYSERDTSTASVGLPTSSELRPYNQDLEDFASSDDTQHLLPHRRPSVDVTSAPAKTLPPQDQINHPVPVISPSPEPNPSEPAPLVSVTRVKELLRQRSIVEAERGGGGGGGENGKKRVFNSPRNKKCIVISFRIPSLLSPL
jgi:hypothetical protein